MTALLVLAVIIAGNVAILAAWFAYCTIEESYAREADARRAPERARMDAAMAEFEREFL